MRAVLLGILVLFNFGVYALDYNFKGEIRNFVVGQGKVYVVTDSRLHQMRLDLVEEKFKDLPNHTHPNKVNILLPFDANGTLIVCGSDTSGYCEVLDINDITKTIYREALSVVPLVDKSSMAFLVDFDGVQSRGTYLLVAGENEDKAKKDTGCNFQGGVTLWNTLHSQTGDIFSTTASEPTESCVIVKDVEWVDGFQTSSHSHSYLFLNIKSATAPSVVFLMMHNSRKKSDMTRSLKGARLKCCEDKPRRKLLSSAVISSGSPLLWVGIFTAQEEHDDTALAIFDISDPGNQVPSDFECSPKCAEVKRDKVLKPQSEVFKVSSMTSVAAQKKGSWIVLYIGTGNGQLIKLVLDKSFRPGCMKVLYRSDDDRMLFSRMYFDPVDHKCIYIALRNQIRRVAVTQCGMYSTLRHCRSSQDPLCGWCMNTSKCSTQDECSNSTWISIPDDSFQKELISFQVAKHSGNLTVTLHLSVEATGHCPLSCTFKSGSKDLCDSLPIAVFPKCSCSFSSQDLPSKGLQVTATVTIGDETLTESLKLRNCPDISESSPYAKCTACVSSGCHWNSSNQTCTWNHGSAPQVHIEDMCKQLTARKNYTSGLFSWQKQCSDEGEKSEQVVKVLLQGIMACNSKEIPVLERSTDTLRFHIPNGNKGAVRVCVVTADGSCHSNATITYGSQPTCTGLQPRITWASGERQIHVLGTNLEYAEAVTVHLSSKEIILNSANKSFWFHSDIMREYQAPGPFSVSLRVGNITVPCAETLYYHPDPEFTSFGTSLDDNDVLITILKNEDRLNLSMKEVNVLGLQKEEPFPCLILEIKSTAVLCKIVGGKAVSVDSLRIEFGNIKKALQMKTFVHTCHINRFDSSWCYCEHRHSNKHNEPNNHSEHSRKKSDMTRSLKGARLKCCEDKPRRKLLSSAVISSGTPLLWVGIFTAQEEHDDTALAIFDISDPGNQVPSDFECNPKCAEVKMDKVLKPQSEVFKLSSMTSVAAQKKGSWIVLYIGTGNGQLIKLVLDKSFRPGCMKVLYRSDDDRMLFSRMHFDPVDHKYIYIALRNQIQRVAVTQCGMYSTLRHCRSSQDPLCGWCMNTSKCSTQDECSNSTWISIPDSFQKELISFQVAKHAENLNMTLHLSVSATGHLPLSCTFKSGSKDLCDSLPTAVFPKCSCSFSSQDLPSKGRQVIATVTIGDETLTESLKLRNCPDISESSPYAKCTACVSSGCHWNSSNQTCTWNHGSAPQVHIEDMCKTLSAGKNYTPEIISLWPSQVSFHGKNNAVMKGKNLEQAVKVRFQGNMDCNPTESPLLKRSTDTLRFNIPRGNKGAVRVCVVTADGSCHSNATITYGSQPTCTGLQPINTWASGKRQIHVLGTNLEYAETVHLSSKEIILNSANKSFWFHSDNMREYQAPGPFNLSLGVGNITVPCAETLYYHPDPEFTSFGTSLVDNDVLITIQKNEDRLNLSMKEVNVLGLQKEKPFPCLILDIKSTTVLCKIVGGKAVSVDSLRIAFGNDTKTLEMTQSATKFLYILVILIILILLGAIAGVWIHRKSQRQMSARMNVRLEQLESEIRNEIRQGFVDLQTEKSDLIENVGAIPFLDYKHFALKIFFPESGPLASLMVKDISQLANMELDERCQALSALIRNQMFLTCFVHTLEEQNNFTIKDKCAVASLLTVALHNDLPYLTQVMEDLLESLMDQPSNAQPKLLLRRTESIVEKMLTNWMSICLYGFLRESVGQPLFLLVSALTQQISQGPVDAVTEKALYTLNEDWLLWQAQDFNFSPLKLKVLFAVGTEGEVSEPLEVKALTCDTIEQVKDKILQTFQRKFGFSYTKQLRDIDIARETPPSRSLPPAGETPSVLIQFLFPAGEAPPVSVRTPVAVSPVPVPGLAEAAQPVLAARDVTQPVPVSCVKSVPVAAPPDLPAAPLTGAATPPDLPDPPLTGAAPLPYLLDALLTGAAPPPDLLDPPLIDATTPPDASLTRCLPSQARSWTPTEAPLTAEATPPDLPAASLIDIATSADLPDLPLTEVVGPLVLPGLLFVTAAATPPMDVSPLFSSPNSVPTSCSSHIAAPTPFPRPISVPRSALTFVPVQGLALNPIPDGASVKVIIKKVHAPLSPQTSLKDDQNFSIKYFHLIDPDIDRDESQHPERKKLKLKEIYLTKLLSTKVAVHSFVENLFRSIWGMPHNKAPQVVKYFFDFLDTQAEKKKITDPDVVHIWKTNSLPLRFWVNILKNPNFVFSDLEKTAHLDSCLSVIAQAFIDSFSLTDQQLGKHAPTNKLLYAKDIPQYKQEVKTYYRSVRDQPSVSSQEFKAFLQEESKKHEYEFNESAALHELNKYMERYYTEIGQKIEQKAASPGLKEKMHHVHKLSENMKRSAWL
ncbi:hypothetical protein P4O66_015482 [Electrophorus voltai]|uniref:PSI domain-containing protein n=1 Tax=Electrophorus voltai TaxID=2609070 RepID=A0AAD8Z181_9TELE|nr:hypothetical protein P4O66_015482 [Electrophorus voltai]